jgi:peroxiredoxin
VIEPPAPEEGAETGRTIFDVTADDKGRLRVRMRLYAGMDSEEEYLLTWDGEKLLESSKWNESEYTLWEAPEEHPDDFTPATLRLFLFHPTSAAFSRQCPGARRVGTRTIAGRVADGYGCRPTQTEQGPSGPREIWLDQATGLMLKSDFLQVQKITADPRVDDSTFSTKPPPGVKVLVIAARLRAGAPAPDFTLSLLKGGKTGLANFAGKPFVLAFFSADLFFDESGEECPGCRDSLIDLQALTHNGTKPTVLGVLAGGPGKPGAPLIPPGVTLPVAYEQGAAVQNRYGLGVPMGFAFVTSAGKIAAIYDHALTRADLQKALDGLS